MAQSSTFNSLSVSITSGLANLRKWYRKTNDTDVYFICLGTCRQCRIHMVVSTWSDNYFCAALDPNYKVAYAKAKWEPKDFDGGMKRLENAVGL